jgi:hypothetical protein
MARVTTVALTLLLMFVSAAPGADEKGSGKSKPVGIWKRTAGDHSITFTIKGDTLQVIVKSGDRTMEFDADYGVSKDHVLFARISKAKKEGDGPCEGDLFSFQFKVEKDTLTVSELKTSHDSAEAKDLVQGEYQRQKEKAE